MPFTLLVGGARSGKSRSAQQLATASGAQVTMVATGRPDDAEMAARIDRHRRDRPEAWVTVEEPLAVLRAVTAVEPDEFIVLDCLTLWVSNLMAADFGDDVIVDDAVALAGALAARPGGSVVVTNEVGMGIVPMNAVGRRYRDLLGTVNGVFADHARRTALMVAGRAMILEGALDV